MNNKAIHLASILCLTLAMSACLKDTAYRTYTFRMYKPVYKTSEEVRANIRNDAPKPVTGAGKMYLLGNYIFLADNGKGVHIINNSNPSNPVNEAYINIPGCTDIAAHGNTLYADCYTDLMTIDISDPKHVILKKCISNIFPDRQFVLGYRIDSGKVISEWIIKDTTINEKIDMGWAPGGMVYYQFGDKAFLYSTASSSASSDARGVGGSMARFAIQSQHLYTVTTSSLNVLDIATPADPQWKKTVSLGWNIETVYPFKDKLFIGASDGMHILSIASPADPVVAGLFTHARVCDPVIADDKLAYVTLRSGSECAGFINQLDIVDVQNISSPSLIKSYPLTNPHGLSKDGDWLFICDGSAGLRVMNAANPLKVSLHQTVPMAETYDVICHNGIAFVSAKDGLYQYDYSDINNIQLLSKMVLSN